MEGPNLEIEINGKDELLSVIPAYLRDNIVKLKFGEWTDEYSLKELERVERNIEGYRFFTPPNKLIKKFFLNHLADRKDKIKRPKIRKDIKAIFTHEEIVKYNLT